jgi:hypothetical protein
MVQCLRAGDPDRMRYRGDGRAAVMDFIESSPERTRAISGFDPQNQVVRWYDAGWSESHQLQ